MSGDDKNNDDDNDDSSGGGKSGGATKCGLNGGITSSSGEKMTDEWTFDSSYDGGKSCVWINVDVRVVCICFFGFFGFCFKMCCI
jgi:hypothetical protein